MIVLTVELQMKIEDVIYSFHTFKFGFLKLA